MRKASCRNDETRIRITLYHNHVGISDVMLENNNARAMNRRFSKIFVPATIHKLSRVSRIVGPSSRGGGLRRRRGFLTFTMPSLAPPPSPAASPRFIVHLSCFTPLEQQSSLTRQITERGSEGEKPGPWIVPRRHFFKYDRDRARPNSRNRRFIYLSMM